MSFSLLKAILGTKRSFLVTVLRTEGHTYKKVGAKSLFEVDEDTPRYGNLGSQCVDSDLIAWGGEAVAAGTPLRKTIDLSDVTDVVFGYGAYCGGKLEVLIEPVGEAERVVYALLLERLGAGQNVRLIHDLKAGSLRIDGQVRDRPGVLESLAPDSIERTRGEASEETSQETWEETWQAPMQVFLYGATPLALCLAPQLQSLDFSPLVLDWRPTYLEKFAAHSRCHLTERGELSGTFPSDACVLILSHVFEQDRDALAAALTAECAFVGMLSSRPRREKIFAELVEQGLEGESVDRVRSPLGLDILGRSDPEIAISILAELIQFRAESNGGVRSSRS